RGDEQDVRRKGEGNRLGDRHQGVAAIRPRTEEGTRPLMERAASAFGKLLEALALLGCAVIFLMTLMICADVLLRNVRLIPGVYGIALANEVSEAMLYLITMLVAPWLLRQG